MDAELIAFNMNSLFLKLIQPFPLDCPVKIGEKHFQEINTQSLKYNLSSLVFTTLGKNQHFISPEECLREYLKNSRDLFLRSISMSVQQEAVEHEIISLLREESIQSLVIKGNAIAKEIYDNPNCRTSSDIDVLIRKTDAVAAATVLLAAGYTAGEDIPLEYYLSRIHHASFRHPLSNAIIEMHWGFGVPYFFKLASEEIWQTVTFSDSGEARLSPEMALVMLLVHHHSHSFRELKILVDILWALHKYDSEINWQLFAMKLKKIGLIRTTWITWEQLHSLWGEAFADLKSAHVLRSEIVKTGINTPRFLLSFFRMDLDGGRLFNAYRDKLVARIALDSPSTIFASYIKTLFPSPDAIRGLYKDQRNWVLPVNYARFMKWRLKDWIRA